MATRMDESLLSSQRDFHRVVHGDDLADAFDDAGPRGQPCAAAVKCIGPADEHAVRPGRVLDARKAWQAGSVTVAGPWSPPMQSTAMRTAIRQGRCGASLGSKAVQKRPNPALRGTQAGSADSSVSATDVRRRRTHQACQRPDRAQAASDFALQHLAATVEAGRADMVSQVHLARGGFDGGAGRAQRVVRTVHAAPWTATSCSVERPWGTPRMLRGLRRCDRPWSAIKARTAGRRKAHGRSQRKCSLPSRPGNGVRYRQPRFRHGVHCGPGRALRRRQSRKRIAALKASASSAGSAPSACVSGVGAGRRAGARLAASRSSSSSTSSRRHRGGSGISGSTSYVAIRIERLGFGLHPVDETDPAARPSSSCSHRPASGNAGRPATPEHVGVKVQPGLRLLHRTLGPAGLASAAAPLHCRPSVASCGRACDCSRRGRIGHLPLTLH